MDPDINLLEPHPLALLYDRDEDGLPSLAASIIAHGMNDEVVILGNQVVDGNRRKEAFRMAIAQGAKVPGGFRWRNFNPKTDGEIWDFILSKNGQRRDAPRGKKALPILREDLKRNHAFSDRSIAARTRCHHRDVRTERERMEAEGLIPHHDGRVDATGRVQEAKKVRPKDAPPDAGDSWEPPADGSADAKADKEVRDAAKQAFDRLGNPLPAHLKDVFADSIYDDIPSSLSWMVRHIYGNPVNYVRLLVKPENAPFVLKLDEFHKWATAFLEHNTPFCLCPDCGGEEGGCATCFSSGFLSQGQCEERKALGQG